VHVGKDNARGGQSDDRIILTQCCQTGNETNHEVTHLLFITTALLYIISFPFHSFLKNCDTED
jgi:hypothetical protein